MEKQKNYKKPQEFHFGDWESSSENDSQENYDSDTICPISLNDLINIERKSQKQKQKQDDDNDFVVPSLADSIDNNNTHIQEESRNLENAFSASVSKILYDFSQNATVLGFDSSFSNQKNQHEKNSNATQTINKTSNNDENDEKLNSFTSLVQNEQTFVKLHQKCFSSSSSDSDIFVVTNNEEILEPDSDSSGENTFEDFRISQVKQSKSQIYESNEKEKVNKSSNHIDLPKIKSSNQINQRKSVQLKKSDIKLQNSPRKRNNDDNQVKIHKNESPKPKEKSENNSNRKSLNQSNNFLNETSKSTSKKSPNKSLNKSLKKQTQQILSSNSSSSSSSSINFDLEDENNDKNKSKKKPQNRKPSINLSNRKRHLNTLSEFSINDYSSYSSYSYSDDEKKQNSASNLIDSLDSTITMKNTNKQQKTQNKAKQQTQKHSDAQNQKHLETQTQKHSETQTQKHSDAQNQKHSETQTQKHSETQNQKHSEMQNQNQKRSETHSQSLFDDDNVDPNSKDKSKLNQSTSNSIKSKNKDHKTDNDSPNKILALQQLNYGDTIVYPKPKKKNSPSKQKQPSSIIDDDGFVDYPTIPPIILSPIQSKQKNLNENSTPEKRVSIELIDQISPEKANENENESNDLFNIESGNESKDQLLIESDNHKSFNVSYSNEVSQNSASEVNISLKKFSKEKDSKNSSSNSNDGILKIGSFDRNRKKKTRQSSSDDDSYSYKKNNNNDDDDKWVDDDIENPSSEFISENNRNRIEKVEKNQKQRKSEKSSNHKKNEKEKIHKKRSNSKSTSENEQQKQQNEHKENEEDKKDIKNESINKTDKAKKNSSPDIDNLNIPITSFYQFISEPNYFNDIDFISFVLTINGVFNLPPPSGVSQLDLVFHFPNLRCSPVVINLKSARFRAGKYEALDSQLLIRIPLLTPNSLPRSFFSLDSSARIATIGDIFNSNKLNENTKSARNSRSNLEDLNGIKSNCLVLAIELMGNGKRLCGSNLCLLESSDSIEKVEEKNSIIRKIEVANFGKHFLRLLLRSDIKCELKKGEKEPLIEIQISKVADNDEKQMSFLPFFSIIHVFFVDSVVSYRQILEHYRIRKENDAIDQRDFDLLSFFSALCSDLATMKKFAKSFKEVMKKMPKDKRSEDDKLKLFVDMLRGSVVQGVTASKNKKEKLKGMLPFSTAQINTINQF